MKMSALSIQELSIEAQPEEDGLVPLALDALAIVGGGEGMICIH